MVLNILLFSLSIYKMMRGVIMCKISACQSFQGEVSFAGFFIIGAGCERGRCQHRYFINMHRYKNSKLSW